MKWLKEEFTKTPGYMRVNLSLLTTLAISSVTSTSLLIRQQVRSTSAENTLYRNESLREERERLRANPIGKSITDPPQNSKLDVSKFGKGNFSREIISLHRTLGKTNYEETRQLFLNNVLTEALDNGEPAYYNSNVLGRYYRKDYFDA